MYHWWFRALVCYHTAFKVFRSISVNVFCILPIRFGFHSKWVSTNLKMSGLDEKDSGDTKLNTAEMTQFAYDDMIVGEHSRDMDLDVNPIRNKELTDQLERTRMSNCHLLTEYMTLEEAIGYVASDELIEDLCSRF
ncbi:unnamed protein product [Lactuca virosa]|uniref:TypA/BipA C-terminal domain-containing protein n=1 Tax=Lactuca virosa TaxID=75947 RepID=A0AAU9LNL9_9ASTR|nr:unnamed protein product [Lactuca virosa]CAH1429898.1 unnamed protein product [Lactuca virosa]